MRSMASALHFSRTLSSGFMLNRNSTISLPEMSTAGLMMSRATLPSPRFFTGYPMISHLSRISFALRVISPVSPGPTPIPYSLPAMMSLRVCNQSSHPNYFNLVDTSKSLLVLLHDSRKVPTHGFIR